MADQAYQSDLREGLEREIAALEAQGVPLPWWWSSLRQPEPGTSTPEQQRLPDTGRSGARPGSDAEPFGVRGGLPGTRPDYTPPSPEELARMKLEARLMFLDGLRAQLDADPELLRFVDNVIGSQVQAAEQRQQERLHTALKEQAERYEVLERQQNKSSLVLTVASSIASLIAGWLLSAVSPVSTLAHLFVR